MEKQEKLNHYSIDAVLDSYNIETVTQCQHLDDWLTAQPTDFSPLEKLLLDELPEELRENERSWNEEELKINFIGAVFRIAKLNVKGVMKTFFERSLSGTVQGKKISVIVDCMVASPKKSGNPEAPYFFLQEYKRSKGDSHDPEGQMLAAMLLAQEKNEDKSPLYGCWVQGAAWRFTVLNGLEYCVSQTFDATNPTALLQIVLILRKLKKLILMRTNNGY